jgi:glycosyltransferase involved in cell wall biosynthesis
MKILYDHQAFSLQNEGGITRYFHEIIRRLCRIDGVQPTSLIGFSNVDVAIKADLTSGGHSSLWSWPHLRPGLARYAVNEAISSGLAMVEGKFDIYHNTLYRFMPLARAKRYVSTHHDCIHERFPELFKDRERIFRAKRKMFSQADLIFCVSESSRADLQEFYKIEPGRAKVIYNGISEMKRTQSGRDQLKNIIDTDFILYVGRRDGYKNFEGLIRAIVQSGTSRTHTLVALGGGTFSAQERRLIRDSGLDGRVVLVPKVSPELLAECYSTASLFVYPSRYEGFGLPPLEAMQLKCPALVARSAATAEVCKDGAFFFDPDQPDEFNEMLKLSLFDSSAREAMVIRGLEVSEFYSWDKCASEVLTGYQSLM